MIRTRVDVVHIYILFASYSISFCFEELGCEGELDQHEVVLEQEAAGRIVCASFFLEEACMFPSFVSGANSVQVSFRSPRNTEQNILRCHPCINVSDEWGWTPSLPKVVGQNPCATSCYFLLYFICDERERSHSQQCITYVEVLLYAWGKNEEQVKSITK